MEPLRIYDYLVLTRRRILDQVRTLSDEQYGREFPMGPGTVGHTLTHMLIGEWYYMKLMERAELPPYDQWPIQDEKPLPLSQLEPVWNEQAQRTREFLSNVQDMNEQIEYRVTSDDGTQAQMVTASIGDICTQLALHEVHHRAQVMNMLRQLGIEAEELDYNALMYTRRDVPV